MSHKSEAIQNAIRLLLERRAAEANYAPRPLQEQVALEQRRRLEAAQKRATATQALRASLTWLCPYCGTVYEPLEQPRPFDQGVTLIKIEHCHCDQARYEREQARRLAELAEARRFAACLDDETWYSAFDPDWPAAEVAQAQLREAKSQVRRWYLSSQAAGGGLLIAGHFGSGKSHLLRAVSRAFQRQGIKGLFYDEYQILDRLKENGDELARACKQAKILVLDDLGRADFDPYTTWKQHDLQAFYFRVLESRARRGLSTLFSTNRKAAELEARVGEAVMDRIYAIISDQTRQVVNWISLWDVPSYRRRYFEQC